MAVPTISTLDPAGGSTRGRNIVEIVGTNFRIAPAPPADGYVGGDAQQTVKVWFEGQAAEWSEAASDTLLLTRVPEWGGGYDALPQTLDVRVANLDDAGAEIAGENVTAADAYTIARPGLAVESRLQRACGEVILLFRRHLLENTHGTMSRDFDDDPADLERKIATLPVIYLIGPNTPLNRLSSFNIDGGIVDPSDPLRFVRYAIPTVVDLSWEVRIYAKSLRHLLSLNQAYLNFFRDITEFVFDGDGYDFRIPFNRYPTIVNVPNQSDLYSIRSAFYVGGLHIYDDDRTMIERGWRVEYNNGEPVVEVQSTT